MRKVRDYDAELKALNDRARDIKAKKIQQLGELVIATGAHALDVETLAGVLLAATDTEQREAWRGKGAAFFQRRGRKSDGSQGSGEKSGGDDLGRTLQPGGDAPPGSNAASD
jgi:hypothetical protein